jgi:CheY-like chemotaxis protein
MEESVLKGKTLLVVDDEADLRDIVASELEFMGAKVFQADNIANAQSILDQNAIDLIVSDIRMPGGTGIDLLDSVKARDVNKPPVILITGFADITLEDAFDKGAEAMLNKPFKLDDLIKLVVRYTSDYYERFNQKVEAKRVIPAEDQLSPFTLGRGGLSVEISTHGRKIEMGECLEFDLKHGEGIFRGQGVCRWYRPVDGSSKAVIGLEIFSLEENSLGHFQKFFENKNLVPYIPQKH